MPNTTVPCRLPCGCTVQVRPGQLGSCPKGHDGDRPDHLRRR